MWSVNSTSHLIYLEVAGKSMEGTLGRIFSKIQKSGERAEQEKNGQKKKKKGMPLLIEVRGEKRESEKQKN